jgi:hypothetical protein
MAGAATIICDAIRPNLLASASTDPAAGVAESTPAISELQHPSLSASIGIGPR